MASACLIGFCLAGSLLLLAAGAPPPAPAGEMKIALSTDFGNENHWRRLIEFAKSHGVERLVYWSHGEESAFPTPWTYPRRPEEFLSREARAQALRVQESLRRSARMTAEAGLKFWYSFQAQMIPDAERLRSVAPELFNSEGEPDMDGDAIYELVSEQLEELRGLAGNLEGIEVWIMEVADFQIYRLAHQRLSTDRIIDRLVATIHDACRRNGWKMTLDLHTAIGNTETLAAIAAAARKRPDIIVSGDNVIGDFSLALPFNGHLREAARTNPISVHFDLNGEYWGRNFVPTSALSQYARDIEEARRLGAECVNGRVSTAHDCWSPHDNILPGFRKHYPPFANKSLQVCCTDTLGRFNAEFFCRRARDAGVSPEQVVAEFLVGQFGKPAESLGPAFLDIEAVNRGLFFMDGNYFVAQSVVRSPALVRLWGWDEHMTSPAGTPFPTERMKAAVRGGRRMAGFAGWPVPVGHQTAGPGAILDEKAQALRAAERLLDRVRNAAGSLAPEDRAFLLRRFEDLVFFARIYRWAAVADVHSLLLSRDIKLDGLPDRETLNLAAGELRRVRAEWLDRYPADPWGLIKIIDDALSRVQPPGPRPPD